MTSPILTEKDLESIISENKSRPKRSIFLSVFLMVIIFGLFSGIAYLFINFQSLKQNLTYWYESEYSTSTNTAGVNSEIILPKQITSATKVSLPEIKDSSIFIPVINISAPISWNVANNADSVKTNLENGTIHLSGTALPGEIGNVFVTGHSSNYPWAKGSYNNVFALINKLVIGDLIQIKYQNIDYVYKVSLIKTVRPDDISVLKPTKTSQLSLMTCTPVGTSINRLIVIANQIYPDPSLNTQSDASGANSLPNVR